MNTRLSSFNKLLLILLAGVFLLTAQPTMAAEQYISDNSVRQDPLQSVKQRGHISVGEFTGAATYNYPIALPPGRNGMTPNIVISHNSQDSSLYNIVGYRWSLSQYSISRLNKHGVEQLYDRNDFMASLPFESGELTEISLTDGAHGQYAQRFESSFAVYEFRDDGSWLVTDKQGNKYIFGSANDGRSFDPADPTRVAEWMLEEIRDPNDNFIRFTYQKLGNQIYPDKIFYTGHGSEEGIFEVRFLVNTSQIRPDKQYSYATGFLVETNYLIKGIEVYSGGELRRKYDLGYSQIAPLVRQTLGSITETGYDENGTPTSLPPTTFDYTPSVISWQETNLYPPPIDIVYYNKTYGLTSVYPIFVDSSGDGLVDFPSGYQANTQKVYLNDGKGGWKYADKADYNLPQPNEPSMGGKFLDFNGDIKKDRFSSYVDYYVFPPQKKSFLELFGIGGSSNSIEVSILNGTGGPKDNGASVADLNGDGLPDLIQSRSRYDSNEETFVEDDTCLNSNGDSCLLTNLWQSPVPIIYDDNLGIQKERITYIEDCNNDGLADVQGYGGAWLNDGKGGWLKPQSGQKCEFTPPDGIFFRSADLNGDGLIDRVHALIEVGYSTDTVVNKLKLNTGQTFLDDVGDFPLLFGRGNGTGQTNSDVGGIRILDLNGDLLPDVVQSFKFSEQIGANWVDTYTKHVYLNTGSRPYFLKTVHTSGGAEINLEYKTSAQYLKPDGSQANPSLPIIIDTVSRMTVDDEQGNVSSTDYFYEDGHYYFENSYDKSFAGFRVVTKTDGLGYKTKSYYHQDQYSVDDSANGEYSDHISKKGRAYRSESYDKNGQLVTSTVNRFEHKSLGADHFYPYLSQTLSQTFDGAVTKATAKAYSYDDVGNVIQVVDYGEVMAGGQDGSFSDTGTDLLKTLMSYVSQSAFPYEQKVHDQNGTQVSDSRTYYDGLTLGQVDKGNVTAQEVWLDSPNSWLRSEMQYNEYGLPIISTNPRGFSTSTTYDSDNLYPDTITNAKGQYSNYIYDSNTGQITHTADPNGSVTDTTYDGLGRPISVEKDGQLISTTTYDDNSNPRSVHATAYNDDGEKVEAYTYIDALDRSIESKQEAPNDNWVTTQTIYDERGNVEKQIQPYFSSSASFESLDAGKIGNSFAYDARGRLLTSVNPLGTTTNSYSGWEVTTTDPNGNPKTLANDARGNLVRIDEKNAGQTYQTYYTHDSLGRLTKIRDAESNERTFAYDSLGRRTFQSKLASPTGWNYVYDENSNLVQKTDPKGQVTSLTYDELDRILTESDLTFTYDQGSYAIGRLSRVVKPNYEHSFTYDLWGRVTNDHRQINDKTFDFAYTYDQMGAVTSMTYPDSTVATNKFDSAHQLEELKVSDKIFADQFDYTPMGQITQMTLGNNVVVQNSYDENQLYRLTSKTAANGLQNYQYTYDPVGNLMNMVDANSGITAKTVSYQYDSLYRLTQADYQNTANQTDVTQTYQYDSLGNMTYKSDVGQFVYNGQHPHAVTQAGSHVYDYDANGNMVLRDSDSMAYDYRDRLILSAGKASFTYGEGYERLTKTDLVTNGVIYYPDKYFEVHPDKEVKYIYAGDLRIAKIEKELFVAPPPTPDPDPTPDPNPNPDPDPTPDPNPNPDPTPDPAPVPPPAPVVSAQGTGGGGGGGGGYGSQAQLTLMRLIREGKDKEAEELANKISYYPLNSLVKEKKKTLAAGELPESAFTNLRITYNQNSALIVWDAMPQNIASFRIYRSKGSNAGPLENTKIFLDEISASRFTNRYVHQFDKADAHYAYQIEALDKNGKSLIKSFKLHANQIFIYENRQKVVDFRNFSDTDFTHVRIKSNTFVDGKETGDPKRLLLKPDTDLKNGARLHVNFLNCVNKKDGSLYCKKTDDQFIEIYVLGRSHPIKETTAFLKDQITRLSAAFIPTAHAEDSLSAEVNDETTYYLLTDHLGSVDVVLNELGEVVERRDYLPYGSERLKESAPNAPQTDHKFTGKELDDETGLYYYGARYYDPLIGRFVSVDPVEGDLKNPQTFNKYTYVLNNPVMLVDPTGMVNVKTGEVEKGDTMTSITGTYNNVYGTRLTPQQLAAINNVSDPDKIQIGQIIKMGVINSDGSIWQRSYDPSEITIGYWNGLNTEEQRITHFGRNSFQDGKLPLTYEEMVMQNYAIASETGKPGWFRAGESTTHNLAGAKNNIDIRGMGINEGKQAIYDTKGNLVTSAENQGTFDFGTPGTEAHYNFDILPWVMWGNTPNDMTSSQERRNGVPLIILELLYGN
ncbi:LysM peptidoglycan-binding domain-containing protein [Patescibacteria group bacterium]|nr:LysM peptidoglycan-binding domain-containing protein [Patescibacteria group bacterium]MBU1016242.1 LysM peptidoglycan-binding domain-containing protein [Patescibacteria group bacterium]MBU1685474.1 LysM peptidoglycan-binding domain-containing protein [Patescibacteria group bacterium]MBU1939100.1 LysM peptidoglycan-binding domain-containing protein [Patescibacteria group bacterium]